ncbi:uncharacterized protein LOC144548889 [Carex rostrata]
MSGHVSQKYSVDTILRNIWESTFKEDCPNFGSLEGLQSALQEKLKGERIEMAAKALGAMNPILLRELDDEQFMSLFISNAIGDAKIYDNHMKGRLISIGNNIATKLRRSPLAAKIVAAQLRRTLDP